MNRTLSVCVYTADINSTYLRGSGWPSSSMRSCRLSFCLSQRLQVLTNRRLLASYAVISLTDVPALYIALQYTSRNMNTHNTHSTAHAAQSFKNSPKHEHRSVLFIPATRVQPASPTVYQQHRVHAWTTRVLCVASATAQTSANPHEVVAVACQVVCQDNCVCV